MKNSYKRKFDYPKAINSSHGPSHHTTRHVLLSLSISMDENLYCWPSIKTLAIGTKLNEKTVRKHLHIAEKEGWIKIGVKGKNGQGWKLHDYHGLIPKRAVLESVCSHKDQEYYSKGTEPNSKTCGNSFQNVRDVDPTNRSINISKNISKGIEINLNKIEQECKENPIDLPDKYKPLLALYTKSGLSESIAKNNIQGLLKINGEEKVLMTYKILQDENLINPIRFHELLESPKKI